MFETIWRAKWTCDGCKTIKAMSKRLRQEADALDKMAADGVKLRDEVSDDYAWLEVSDPKIAKKYKMEKSEDMDEDE